MTEEWTFEDFRDSFRVVETIGQASTFNTGKFFDLEKNAPRFGYWFDCFDEEHFRLATLLAGQSLSLLDLEELPLVVSWDAEFCLCSAVLRGGFETISQNESNFTSSLYATASKLLDNKIVHGAIDRDCILRFSNILLPVGFGAKAYTEFQKSSVASRLNFDAFSYLSLLRSSDEFRTVLSDILGEGSETTINGEFDEQKNYLALFKSGIEGAYNP